MGSNLGRQHAQEGAVERLHESITLRVIGGCSHLLDVQQPTYFSKYLCFKLAALIEMELLRWGELQEQFIGQSLGHSGSFWFGMG